MLQFELCLSIHTICPNKVNSAINSIIFQTEPNGGTYFTSVRKRRFGSYAGWWYGNEKVVDKLQVYPSYSLILKKKTCFLFRIY